MAKKKAARPKSGLLQSRPTDEQWAELVAYCHENDLSLSEFVRLGTVRALRRPPTKAERGEIAVPLGNPHRGEHGRFGSGE